MNCKEIHPLLTQYLLGDLIEDQRQAVEAHLAECDACRAERDALEPTLALLTEALSEPAMSRPRLSADRRERILHPGRVRRTIEWIGSSHPGLAVAAGLVFVVGLVWMMMPAKMKCNARSSAILSMTSGEAYDSFSADDFPQDLTYSIKVDEPELLDALEEIEEPPPAPPLPLAQPAPEPVEMNFVVDGTGSGDSALFYRQNQAEPKPILSAKAKKAMDKTVSPPPEDISPKPAEFDSVAIVNSPVVMNGMLSARNPGKNGAASGEVLGRSVSGDDDKEEETRATYMASDIKSKIAPAQDESGARRERRQRRNPARSYVDGVVVDQNINGSLGPIERSISEVSHQRPEASSLGDFVALEEQAKKESKISLGGLGMGGPAPVDLAEMPVTTRREKVGDKKTSEVRRLDDSRILPMDDYDSGIKSEGRSAGIDTGSEVSADRDEWENGTTLSLSDSDGDGLVGGYKYDAEPDNVPERRWGWLSKTRRGAEEPEEEVKSGAGTSETVLGREIKKGEDRLKKLPRGQTRVTAVDEEETARDVSEMNVAEAEKDRLERKADLAKATLGKCRELANEDKVVDEETDLPGRFKAFGVNPFIEAIANPFSTFAIDVDTAAYTLGRNYMQQGIRPPAESVRTEEYVNFFDYAYKAPTHKTFKVYTEMAPSKFGRGLHLLKIGVKGREEQRPAALTFVIDTSGSMNQPDRLGLVQKSLTLLVNQLSPNDVVTILQYGSHARLVLEPTPAANKEDILNTIKSLQCSGSTNLEEGMHQAYALASANFIPKGENRVLLLSDGVANLGSGAADDILAKVDSFRRQGITCSVFGFGMGTYDDTMLETLANKGDGTYTFIDSESEAKRVFVDDLSATLNTIATDVKIQVEYNSGNVKRYRQLGYENRQLKKDDFRNDAVDAGEVGSGQSVTALYELELNPAIMHQVAKTAKRDDVVATVRVRYRRVDTGVVEEIEHAVRRSDIINRFDDAPMRFKLAASVAEFSEIMRGSHFARGSSFQDVANVLRPVALELKLDRYVQELLRLVEGADGMSIGR
jgi:Ca-activated chloride channel family protein